MDWNLEHFKPPETVMPWFHQTMIRKIQFLAGLRNSEKNIIHMHKKCIAESAG